MSSRNIAEEVSEKRLARIMLGS
jgi:hypothetical protein